ncbi:MAG: cytochrome c oxidase subunit 3 [Planctomycetota bacterium]|nr:cytochrome c oxidase subunit 3 [Planctomycetota bacterium]
MTTEVIDRWRSGKSPWGHTWQKNMMWWFIVTDGLLFAGFLCSYGFSRLGSSNWPPTSAYFSTLFLTTMTFILITSSATMACAVGSSRAGDRKATRKFLLLTILGGLAFLGMQAFEWTHVIAEGLRPGVNPHGDTLFGAYFFIVTGFHGTHVLIGVLVILITFLKRRGETCDLNPDGVELTGLYWHFVDLVWVVIFGAFYLIGS